jgi:hypothetical protein
MGSKGFLVLTAYTHLLGNQLVVHGILPHVYATTLDHQICVNLADWRSALGCSIVPHWASSLTTGRQPLQCAAPPVDPLQP